MSASRGAARSFARDGAEPAPRVTGERPVGAPSGAARATEPCLHCGHPVAVRLMGCKGGHCPNCRHPYPHGDCSD